MIAATNPGGSLVPDDEPNKIEHPKKRALLAAYARHGNVSRACRQANVGRTTAYEWLKEEGPEGDLFRKSMFYANEEACSRLEQEARRRAIHGYEEPVFGSGGNGAGTVRVGTIRKFSDTLLIFLMKGAMPEKYGEKKDQQSSSVNVAVQVSTGVQDLLSNPDYVKFLEHRTGQQGS